MFARNTSRLRLLAPVLLFVLFLPPVRAEPLDTNCFQQCPVAKTDNRVLIRTSHTLSNNAETKFADWVAYDVVPAGIGKSQRRVWRPDPMLPPDESLEPADYKGAHKALKTDRGHQAPLASFTGAPGWKATNTLSNITPQKSALNQGPWKRLEGAVRKLAKSRAGHVHVITGPLYERDMPPLPQADEAHRVPSGYWKIISLLRGDELEVAGFVLDQETPRKADFCDKAYKVSVAEIALRSGLTFAPGLVSSPVKTLRARLGCAAIISSSEAAPRS
ncbi:DNA/RNA non-specific endonuclease [Nisaea nitritireducens]|uniref:DNA/RNA non-specific endonuclease n=1 Tax=Nisaea nitritireducens TaxID=568392 RepID=UPI00186860C1|nr:DNA/RNA non-specific endonuclease [Nisaea nitritireducens]